MQNDEKVYSSQSPEFLEVYPERKGKILQEDKKTILSKIYNREKIVKSCQKEVLFCFENVPYLKLLWESIENRGCKLDLNRHFSCEICQPGKGQLISECLFDFFKFSKKNNEKIDKFLPQNLKSGHIIK